MDNNYFRLHNSPVTKKLSITVVILLFVAVIFTVNRSLERQGVESQAQESFVTPTEIITESTEESLEYETPTPSPTEELQPSLTPEP